MGTVEVGLFRRELQKGRSKRDTQGSKSRNVKNHDRCAWGVCSATVELTLVARVARRVI